MFSSNTIVRIFFVQLHTHTRNQTFDPLIEILKYYEILPTALDNNNVYVIYYYKSLIFYFKI